MNKDEGQRLAALSFTEKIELLEKLRDRSVAFSEAREKLARERRNVALDWSECDIVEADRISGHPVVRGTTMAVEDIVLTFNRGASIEKISQQFEIDPQLVKNILDYAKKHRSQDPS